MTCMNYGELPTLDQFQAAWDREELANYPIEANQREWTFLASAVNQGIDPYLEVVACVESSGEQGRGRLVINDASSLRTLVKRLIETDDWEDEGAIDFASCILSTLDIDWV